MHFPCPVSISHHSSHHHGGKADFQSGEVVHGVLCPHSHPPKTQTRSSPRLIHFTSTIFVVVVKVEFESWSLLEGACGTPSLSGHLGTFVSETHLRCLGSGKFSINKLPNRVHRAKVWTTWKFGGKNWERPLRMRLLTVTDHWLWRGARNTPFCIEKR